jgi:hypothetical protein
MSSLCLYGSSVGDLKPLLEYADVGSSTNVSSDSVLTLDNKYYTADISLVEMDSSGYSEGNSAYTLSEETEGYINLLTWKEASDESLSTALLAHGKQAQEIDVTIRILVIYGNTDDCDAYGNEVSEDRLSILLLWCLDHGFEMIHIDMATSQVYLTKDEREKEGLPRLIESLASHTWRTMVFKESSSGGGRAATSEDSVFQLNTSSRAATEVEAASEEGEAKKEGDKNPFLEKMLKEEDEETYAQMRAREQAEDDQAETVMMDMIMKAKQMREAVDAGTLSDADRREQAASMAMKFAEMMALGEDESSDEEN